MEQTLPETEQTGESQAVADTLAQAVAEFDLTTPEGVRKAAEKYPAFKAVFADERNAERQRTMAEIRRSQGTQEVVQKQIEEITRRLAAGENPEAISKDLPLVVKANRESMEIDAYKALFEQAKAIDPDSVTALQPFADQEGLTVEHWKNLSTAAVNAVANSSKKAALTEWLDSEQIDDIPAESKKYQALKAKFEKELQMELKAREIESRQVPAVAPKTPSGDNVEPITRERLDSMTRDERMNFIMSRSDEERSALWELALS